MPRTPLGKPPQPLLWTSLALAAWSNASIVHAHEGPPFPIIVDHEVPGFELSVWSDPDIGVASFYAYLACDGECPRETPPTVELSASSNDDVGAQVRSVAVPTKISSVLEYRGELPLAHGGMWQIRVVVISPRGRAEAITSVEATPSGVIGPWASLLYAIPFVAIAVLWVIVSVKKAR